MSFEQKNVEERLRQHLKISDVAVEEPPPLESSESEEEEEEEVEEGLPDITDEMEDVSNNIHIVWHLCPISVPFHYHLLLSGTRCDGQILLNFAGYTNGL